MAAETGFKIDGQLCEIPTIDTFTLDEAQILYDYTGLAIQDFAPPEDADEEQEAFRAKLKNPGFLRTLVHVAYQRANPRTPTHKVKALIGSMNLIGVIEDLVEQEEDDAGPPVLTTERDASSPNGSVGSSANSGDGSSESSDGQVVPLTPTTTSGLDTSFTHSPASSVV